MKEYYRLNNAIYQASGYLRHAINPGKVKPQSGVGKVICVVVVHILKQTGQLPQIFPPDAKVICQPIQGKYSRLVFSCDDTVNRCRAEPGFYG